jgi:hypothetical protein
MGPLAPHDRHATWQLPSGKIRALKFLPPRPTPRARGQAAGLGCQFHTESEGGLQIVLGDVSNDLSRAQNLGLKRMGKADVDQVIPVRNEIR